jgi:hypothetical protein
VVNISNRVESTNIDTEEYDPVNNYKTPGSTEEKKVVHPLVGINLDGISDLYNSLISTKTLKETEDRSQNKLQDKLQETKLTFIPENTKLQEVIITTDKSPNYSLQDTPSKNTPSKNSPLQKDSSKKPQGKNMLAFMGKIKIPNKN